MLGASFLLIAASAAPQSERPGAEPMASVSLTTPQLFDLAQQLTAQGATEEALRIWTLLANNPDRDFRLEARARIARLYVAKSDFRSAATWFQRILDENPSLSAIRIELANALAQLGNEGGAARQLRRAASAPGLPRDVSRALGRASAAIAGIAPFSASVEVGLSPDSNINRATQARQIDILGLPFELNDDGRATSGLGLTINASATARSKIRQGVRWIAQINSSGEFYGRTSFNDITVTASGGPEFLSARTRFRLTPIVGKRWLGQQQLYDIYGLTTNLERMVAPTVQISLSNGITYLDYTHRPDLSGNIYAVSAGVDASLSPRLSVRFGLNGNRFDAASDQNATKSWGGDVTISRDMGAFTAFGRATYSRTLGDTAFRPFLVARDEHFVESQLGLIFRQISVFGLSPLLRASFSRNDSAVPLFSYRRRRFDISVTRTF
jgi:outer membrane protein